MRKKYTRIFAIVLAVVIVVGGAYVWINDVSETEKDVSEVSAEPISEQVNGGWGTFINKNADVVSGWTIYKNNDFGFTINRPINWSITGRDGNRIVDFSSPLRRHRDAFDSTYDYWFLSIDFFDSGGKTLTDIINNEPYQDPDYVRSKKINLNGIQGIERSVLTFAVCITSVYLPTSSGIYKISYESTTLDFEQICNSGELPEIFKHFLDTFRLIE